MAEVWHELRLFNSDVQNHHHQSKHAMRRVVVTGLGLVTPLGVGVRRTWSRLIEGHCGITSIKDRSPRFAVLPSQVAAVVPEGAKEHGKWNAKQLLNAGVGCIGYEKTTTY